MGIGVMLFPRRSAPERETADCTVLIFQRSKRGDFLKIQAFKARFFPLYQTWIVCYLILEEIQL